MRLLADRLWAGGGMAAYREVLVYSGHETITEIGATSLAWSSLEDRAGIGDMIIPGYRIFPEGEVNG